MEDTTYHPRVRIVTNGVEYKIEKSRMKNELEVFEQIGESYFTEEDAQRAQDSLVAAIRAHRWWVWNVVQT